MNKIGLMVAVLGLTVAGCKRGIVETSTSTPEAQPTEANQPSGTPRSSADSGSTPAPSPPAQTTATPQFAPPGVFYLIAAARVETVNGIQGLPPGTGVKLVRDDIYLTPAGEVPLDPRQLTNDMTRARAARDADRAIQASAQAKIAAQGARAAEAGRSAVTTSAPTPTPRFVEGTSRQGSTGLQASTTLGASHTRTKNGILWQKSPDGKYWRSVKYLNGGAVRPAQSEPVR